jgi:two-component system response regulator FixJ
MNRARKRSSVSNSRTPHSGSVRNERIIHIVDGDPDIRLMLDQLLSAVAFKTATYDDPFEFLKVAPSLKEGCLLLDVKMPWLGGLELQQRLNDLGFALPIIVLTAQGDVPSAVEALKAGALDFFDKPFDKARVLTAITDAMNTSQQRTGYHEAAKRVAALSPRERSVLEALMAGRSNKQIAYSLAISVRTVEAHRARMLTKLETHSLAEAVRIAILAKRFVQLPFRE